MQNVAKLILHQEGGKANASIYSRTLPPRNPRRRPPNGGGGVCGVPFSLFSTPRVRCAPKVVLLDLRRLFHFCQSTTLDYSSNLNFILHYILLAKQSSFTRPHGPGQCLIHNHDGRESLHSCANHFHFNAARHRALRRLTPPPAVPHLLPAVSPAERGSRSNDRSRV